MRTIVPDWSDRIRIGIKAGAIGQVNLAFDNQGNPVVPEPPNDLLAEDGSQLLAEDDTPLLTE